MTGERMAAVGVTFLLAACLGTAAEPPGGSWPQFHGPRRDNVSDETGLLAEWPQGGPKLLWNAGGIGHGFASVAVQGGRIYTSGNVGDETRITALDLGGKVLWQAANGKAWADPVPGGRGTPTLDGDRLYHLGPHGDLVCLDARTGARQWGVNILEAFGGRNITWGLAESVLVDGGRVICAPGGQTALVALDKTTGRPVWKAGSAGDGPGYASASLGEWHGLRQVFTLTSRAAIGVNADTGELLWRFPHETPFDEMIGMPVYHEGHVLISTRTTGTVLLGLEVDGKKCNVRPVWRTDRLDNQHGGLVRRGDLVFGCCHVNNNGKWVCLDWATGKQAWADQGPGKGTLTCADGRLVLMSERGAVALVKATAEGYMPVGEFHPPVGGEGPYWAHPVVCGGRLYLRHSDRLFAYDVKGNK